MKEVKKTDVSRRDFHKLTLAAFGGVLAGSVLGGSGLAWAEEKAEMAKESHLCCGLNTCKAHGAGGQNECAGMGSCATTEAHACKGHNACKGAGGGEDAGANACKGHGNCAVPLKGEAWTKARANFEASMTKAGQKFGPAPASCGK